MIRYAVTAGTGSATELLQSARRWAAEGIDFVQLREKHLGAADLVTLAEAMLRIFSAGGSRTKLLINARADVAVAAGADGVHLTSRPGELTAGQVRRVFAHAGLAAPVVSASCHALDEVRRAREDGVGLILFGPVFEKRIAGELIAEGEGLDTLGAACRAAAPTPVLALGGISAENTASCIARGAAGIAGIRLFS